MRHETITPAAALLLKARGKLDQGWCQGALESKSGKVCMLGALNWAEHGNANNSFSSLNSHDAWRALRLVTRSSSLGDFNDTRGRTKAEVLEMFDRAIAKVLEPVR